jgi:hypothetical protein
VLGDENLWTSSILVELNRLFVQNLDEGASDKRSLRSLLSSRLKLTRDFQSSVSAYGAPSPLPRRIREDCLGARKTCLSSWL